MNSKGFKERLDAPVLPPSKRKKKRKEKREEEKSAGWGTDATIIIILDRRYPEREGTRAHMRGEKKKFPRKLSE